MKWFTLPALLAAALLSAIVAIPFVPFAKNHADVFYFEVRAASTAEGRIKIYYDVGRGYIEADSADQALAKSDAAQLYRLALPTGDCRSIRFDPIDAPGLITVTGPLRIMSETGRVLQTIAPSDLEPLQQVESVRAVAGRFEIRVAAPANDPQLRIVFSPPLTLTPSWRERLVGYAPRALGVFGALAVVLFGLHGTTTGRRRFSPIASWVVAYPYRATALVAAAAVILSAYPVVFLGKSFVAPNFGTTLLYEAYPTLPGSTDARTASANGSDIGAAMWADVPYAFMQHRALMNGELPLWNRYTIGGVPLLAQGQSMFGDPLHWIVMLSNGAAWAWDIKFLAAKWLFATGVGFLVLWLAGARAAGPPFTNAGGTPALPAAVIVAASAPFIGFYIYRINHPAVFSVGYAPWVLLAWLCVAHAVDRRAASISLAGLWLANFSLMSSGTAKEAAILLLVMSATGAALVLTASMPWRTRLMKLAGAAWVGGLLLMVSAPVSGTFVTALRDAYTGSANAAAAQIQPSLLLGAFDELLFRPLNRDEVVFNPSLNLLLLLGVLYFLATIRVQLRDRSRRVLVAATLGCMAFVFGVIPISTIVELPFLGHIGHIENCFLCALLVLWSVLAGMGFATAATRLRTPEGRADLLIAVSWLFALVFAWMAFRQVSHREIFGPGTTFSVHRQGSSIPVSTFIWASLLASVVACIALGLVARHAAVHRCMGAGGAITAVACAVILLWRHGMHDLSLGFETYLVQPPARANFHARSTAIEFVRERHRAEPTRIFGLHGNLTPGWNAAYGLEAIYGADALQNRWVRELIDVSPVHWSSIWRVYVAAAEAGRARPFLDALNVRYYVDMPSNPDVADAALQRIHSSDLAVYESASAWPRAFFTDRVDRYERPADLVAKIIGGDGKPFAALQAAELAGQPELAALSHDLASRRVIPATKYRLTENTTSFDVHAPSVGIVVLHEGWWPGAFQVDVNGRRAPIVRVNHAFKGILMPAAGDFRVTFSYWPNHFSRYLAVAAAGLVLGAISLLVGFRRPKDDSVTSRPHDEILGREPTLPTA